LEGLSCHRAPLPSSSEPSRCSSIVPVAPTAVADGDSHVLHAVLLATAVAATIDIQSVVVTVVVGVGTATASEHGMITVGRTSLSPAAAAVGATGLTKKLAAAQRRNRNYKRLARLTRLSVRFMPTSHD
jgi:hypothetical protein